MITQRSKKLNRIIKRREKKQHLSLRLDTRATTVWYWSTFSALLSQKSNNKKIKQTKNKRTENEKHLYLVPYIITIDLEIWKKERKQPIIVWLAVYCIHSRGFLITCLFIMMFSVHYIKIIHFMSFFFHLWALNSVLCNFFRVFHDLKFEIFLQKI